MGMKVLLCVGLFLSLSCFAGVAAEAETPLPVARPVGLDLPFDKFQEIDKRLKSFPQLGSASVVVLRNSAAAAPVGDVASTISDFAEKLANLYAKLKAKGTADLVAADALAAAPDPDNANAVVDPIAHACYPALEKFVDNLPSITTTNLTGLGLFQVLEYKRLAYNSISGGLPTYLKLGCDPLLQNEVQILIKLGASVGLSIVVPSNILSFIGL